MKVLDFDIDFSNFIACIHLIYLIGNCFLVNKDYYGKNIGQGECPRRDSLAKCQELCQQTATCIKFTYVTDSYNGKFGAAIRRSCCLKADASIKAVVEPGTISGPKICQGKV